MINPGSAADRGTFAITRERLLDGSHLAAIRSRAGADFTVRSDAELEANLDEALARHPSGQDVWVFGYGSLMWNPAFHFVETRVGTVRGWHRRFCLRQTRGRGTAECPGLTLALDRGGTCRGVAFRVAAEEARSELLLVWRREMLSGAYLARWVKVTTEGGVVRAVTFAANASHTRYAGKLAPCETAERILVASGELGTSLDYFERTAAALHGVGIRDAGLERIAAEIAARSAAGQEDAGSG